MSAVVAVRGLTAGYQHLPAVRELDLEVHAGEIVALLGPNGAGKTTTILSIAGLVEPMNGHVEWEGAVLHEPVHRRALRGLALVTEGRSITRGLTVGDNFRLGGADAELAYSWFPALRPLEHRRAGLLSGGEQQMLGLGRALSRIPKALLVDELSLGLAPMVADRLAGVLRERADDGLAVLVVEQDVRRALAISDRFVVLRQGVVTLAGRSADHRERADEFGAHYLRAGAVSPPA